MITSHITLYTVASISFSISFSIIKGDTRSLDYNPYNPL